MAKRPDFQGETLIRITEGVRRGWQSCQQDRTPGVTAETHTQGSATAFSTRAPPAYLAVNADTSPFVSVFTTFAGFVVIHLGVVIAVIGVAIAVAS